MPADQPKGFPPGALFLVAAILWFVAAGIMMAKDKSGAVYISLGVVFLILAIAQNKRK